MAEEHWNTTYAEPYCENKIIPFLIPGVFEFFSFLIGFYLIMIGLIGILQPHLETMHKLLYSALTSSGIGTVLNHWKPILLCQYYYKFSLSFMLSYAVLALFEDVIAEYTFREREDAKDGKIDNDARNNAFCGLSLLRGSYFRVTMYNALMLFVGGLYLLGGLILVVFTYQFFTFDVSEIYFGIPYLVLTGLGVQYITGIPRPKVIEETFRKLKITVIVSNIVTLVFRLIDAYGCSGGSVWIFPHPFYHVFQGYTVHAIIIFLVYARVTRGIVDPKFAPIVEWRYLLFPRIKDVSLLVSTLSD